MTRQERIDQVAMVIFRQRGGRLIPGDRLSPETVEYEDKLAAERFIDMLDGAALQRNRVMSRVSQTTGGFALRVGTWHLTGEFFGGDIRVRGALPLPGIVISPEEATEIGLRFLALAVAGGRPQLDAPSGAALVYARDAVAALEATPETQRTLAVAIGAASQVIDLGVRALGNLAPERRRE